MTASERLREVALVFASETGPPGVVGSFFTVPNEAWSHATRIAYRDADDIVHVTKEGFGTTTTSHVNAIRYTLSRAGYVNDGEDDADGWELWKRRR